jgi:large subunit ribosomal protein L13
MKTYLAKNDEVERKWILLDADGAVLGRLAVQIATILRGRNKPVYTPHVDTGDFVIVVNAEKVVLTGSKNERKIYQTYSGHMGGQKEVTAQTMRDKQPQLMIGLAVKGMMPKGRLARQQLRKLKVYAGPDHPHAAQNPETIAASH